MAVVRALWLALALVWAHVAFAEFSAPESPSQPPGSSRPRGPSRPSPDTPACSRGRLELGDTCIIDCPVGGWVEVRLDRGELVAWAYCGEAS